MIARLLFSSSCLMAAVHAGGGESYCDVHPEDADCYVNTNPTGRPTSFPTILYTHDIADFGEAKLYSPDSISSDYYGFSTAVWDQTVLVGAYATVAYGSLSGDVTGAVFVYEEHSKNMKRLSVADSDGTYYGYAVSVWDGVALVGAPREDFQNCNDCGAVYVYRRIAPENWTLEATLVAEDYIDYHYVGFSTAIYEDCVITGAPGDNEHGTNTGAAYAFNRDPSTGLWAFKQKLSVTQDNENRDEKDKHRGEQFDHFGSAVAIFGQYASVGAYGDDRNTGAVYMYFHYGDGAWGPLYKLTASDLQEGQFFGYSVAMYDNTVVVGAYGADGHWYGTGAAYVFEISSGGLFPQVAKLIAHDGMSSDFFGFSVAIFENVIVVGAHGEEGKGHGKGGKRRLPGGGGGGAGEGGQKHEGENCGPNSPPDCKQFDGEYSYRGTGAGAAYVFKRSASFWGQVMKIIPAVSEAYDHFGVSVSTYNEEFIIGADTADGIVDDTGAAYVYYPTFKTDFDREQEGDEYSTPVDTSSGNFFGLGENATAAFAFVVVLAPVALGIVWWFSSAGKSAARPRDGLMQLPQDSRHGSSVPWSMHGAFDESSWGLESSHSPNTGKSPLRAPANVAGR